jgi:hypothetical protein
MKVIIAVLALVLVSQKDVATRKGGSVVLMLHVIDQGNNARQGDFQTDGANGNVGIDIHHDNFSAKDGFDRLLPGP